MTLLKFKQAPVSQAFPALNNIFDLFDNSIHAGFRNWVTPAVNIIALKDKYELQVAAPGLRKEDFKINIEGDEITLSAELKTESEQKDINYSHREFQFSSFKRRFTLPQNVNTDEINASYENGVLKLTIPVMQEEKSKTREISIA
jgi:HSP20 family protein